MSNARRRPMRLGHLLERFAMRATQWTGTSWAFGCAFLVVAAWLITGPLFGFTDTWQLVINTGTTIVTLLMVFLIQRTQNKDSLAVQLKLNELVAAMEGASNRLIDVEDLDEEELQTLRSHFQKLSQIAKRESRHRSKQRLRRGGSKSPANRTPHAS